MSLPPSLKDCEAGDFTISYPANRQVHVCVYISINISAVNIDHDPSPPPPPLLL